MGSSHSQPARPSPPSQPAQASQPARPPSPPRRTTNSSSTSSTLRRLRRLSTLGRPREKEGDAGSSGSGGSKRGRQMSTADGDGSVVSPGDRKKQRTGSMGSSPQRGVASGSGSGGGAAWDTDHAMVSASASPSAGPSTPAWRDDHSMDTSRTPTPYPQPLSPTFTAPPPPLQSRPTSPPASPPLDPLGDERLRSLSTIRDALGPEWPTDTSPAASAADRVARQRRPLSAQVEGVSAQARTLADRIAALSARLNRATPSTPTSATAGSATASGSSRTTSPRPNISNPLGNPFLRSNSLDPIRPFLDPNAEAYTPLDLAGSSQSSHPHTHAAESSTTGIPDDDRPTVEELARRLNEAREELAQTERQLNETRERIEATRRRRVPAGAVLVIQGLAQTHTSPDAERETPTSPGLGGSFGQNNGSGSGAGAGESGADAGDAPRRSSRLRRASESNVQPRRPQPREDDRNGTSLDQQARMIGGLLTVAAAATATTLLTPHGSRPPLPELPPRPSPASALESVLNRIRPNRQQRSQQSVEAALGNYFRSVLRDNRQAEAEGQGQGDAPDSGDAADGQAAEGEQPQPEGPRQSEAEAEEADEAISNQFQQFLEDLQLDLVGAVRAFAGPLEPEAEAGENGAGEGEGEGAGGDEESFMTATEGAMSPRRAGSPLPPGSSSDANVADAPNEPPVIPSFHPQLGQNLSTDPTRVPEVTGGHDGIPRRLNFFRAHLFPAVSAITGMGPPPENEADAIVPCIFIGVRSIRHDPAMTTEDLVAHPSFPFVDGHVPDAEGAGGDDGGAGVGLEGMGSASGSGSAEQAPAPAPPPPAERRSLRSRLLSHLSRRSPSPRPVMGPLNTYLVYVIGGNYPRSHPVLSMPSLVSGGPLSDEEMALVGEMMGPAKPPTVERGDIEKSGLKVVRGAEMKELGKKGGVVDSCVERCLVCLADYEDDDECRILNCRHGFHKECVDQWLSVGRNSCPACRSEAVQPSGPSWANGENAGAEAAADMAAPAGVGLENFPH
ncbi:hypothetical protein IAT38_002114 [Cryptococcus sp. DSM 104549]